jgi:hypothetical protein
VVHGFSDRARVLGRSELLLHESIDQSPQGQSDDLVEVAVRNAVAQQVLRLPQHLMCARARGELHLETFGRELHDPRMLVARRR